MNKKEINKYIDTCTKNISKGYGNCILCKYRLDDNGKSDCVFRKLFGQLPYTWDSSILDKVNLTKIK